MRRAHEVPGVWKGILGMMEKGQLKPSVFEKVYEGLEGVAPALEALGSRGTWGKVVINVKKDKSPKL